MEERGATVAHDMAPPPAIAALLRPNESVVAIRRDAVWASLPCTGADGHAIRADVYLTNRRLLLVGDRVAETAIEDITEVGLEQSFLIVALRGGLGISLRVEQPGALRVNIATVRRRARGERRAAIPSM